MGTLLFKVTFHFAIWVDIDDLSSIDVKPKEVAKEYNHYFSYIYSLKSQPFSIHFNILYIYMITPPATQVYITSLDIRNVRLKSRRFFAFIGISYILPYQYDVCPSNSCLLKYDTYRRVYFEQTNRW